MTNAVLRGTPDAGNPHVRFDEGEVVSVKPRRGSSRCGNHLVFSLAFGLCALAASAGTLTWIGGTDTKWSTPENWNTKACPVNGDELVFANGGSGTLALENDLTGLSLASLTFNAGRPIALSGNPVTLTAQNAFTAACAVETAQGFDLMLTGTSEIKLSTTSGEACTFRG